MNRKQRSRKLDHRRQHIKAATPIAVVHALGKVHEQAFRDRVQVTEQYLNDNMTAAGFLPTGNGRWRSMTPVERKRWLGRDA